MNIKTLLKHPVTRQLGGAVAGMVIALGGYEGYLFVEPHMKSMLAQSLPPIIPIGSFNTSSSSSSFSSVSSSSSSSSVWSSSSVSSSSSSVNTVEEERLKRQAQIAALARSRLVNTVQSSSLSSVVTGTIRRVVVDPGGVVNNLPPIQAISSSSVRIRNVVSSVQPEPTQTASVTRRHVVATANGDTLPQSGPGLLLSLLGGGGITGALRQRRKMRQSKTS